MDTVIKATVLAANLKKQLTKLQAERKAALNKFDLDFKAWKAAAVRWCAKELPARITRTTRGDLLEERSRYNGGNALQLNADRLFDGAPKPPTYPSEKRITEVRALLRQLSISGQVTMKLSTTDVAKFLGPVPGDDGED